MKQLRLIDFFLPIPEDVRVETDEPIECEVDYCICGANIDSICLLVNKLAFDMGYIVERHENTSIFTRDEGRILLHRFNEERIGITVWDEASLPRARVNGQSLCICDLELPVPMECTVVAAREYHKAGSNAWRAKWTLCGTTVPILATSFHERLIKAGYKSYGVWQLSNEPSDVYWKVEVTLGGRRLVQIRITSSRDALALVEIDCILP